MKSEIQTEQKIQVTTNDPYESNVVSTDVFTRNIDNKLITYIDGRSFATKHDISERTLGRGKAFIISNLPKELHRYYFTKKDSKLLFTEKMLEFRKYEKIKKKTGTYTIVYPQYELYLNSPLFEKIRKYDWQYTGGSSYKGFVGIDSCVERMEELFSTLKKDYPEATITLFYTTEYKNKFHNHFVLSVFHPQKEATLSKLSQAIRLSTGTLYPEVELIRKGEKDELLEYMIKEVDVNPDGWGILSNSKAEINRLKPSAKHRLDTLLCAENGGLKSTVGVQR